MNDKGGYDHVVFNDAVNYCAKFNSTLVELHSQRKQSTFESFMREIGEPLYVNALTDRLNAFWINGHRDSSGKFKWINSGKEFTYTNWDTEFNEPKYNGGYDYVVASVWNNHLFGKWFTQTINFNGYVHAICELEINI